LSEELYSESTHFLLELLQNADDNTYHSEPTLKITYRIQDDGASFLQIDSNEIGFTYADVVALCSIGNSTKKGSGHAKNATGEKGIGFKSVFRVAEKVYVSSRAYTSCSTNEATSA
jgi:HSP90 family molecular chaperone